MQGLHGKTFLGSSLFWELIQPGLQVVLLSPQQPMTLNALLQGPTPGPRHLWGTGHAPFQAPPALTHPGRDPQGPCLLWGQ